MNYNPEYISTTRLAKQFKLKSTDIFNELITHKLIIKDVKTYKLTKNGVKTGGIYQTNDKNETWIAWRTGALNQIIDIIMDNKKQSNITNHILLVVNHVEIKESYTNESSNESTQIIVCTIENEENYYYELKKKIYDYSTSRKLVEKIKKKGIIDTQYWIKKDIDKYDYYDSDLAIENNMYDYHDEFDLVNEVSRELGYSVDEDLARAFMHDKSKL